MPDKEVTAGQRGYGRKALKETRMSQEQESSLSLSRANCHCSTPHIENCSAAGPQRAVDLKSDYYVDDSSPEAVK